MAAEAAPAARWVADPAALDELAADLSEVDAFAFDTEFHRERTYYPHLALLQVAWPGGIALVDPVAVDIAPLGRCFAGAATVVAHAAAQDLEVLERACGVLPARLFDTQIGAGFLGFATPSLLTLGDRMLGLHLPKGDRLTDWRQRPLTEAQRSYAAADVAHLLRLWQLISEQLIAAGRLAWAEDECRLLAASVRQPQDPETAWWRIKEARQLRGRARAIAQEVGAWRERAAAQSDRPVRTVLSDLAVVTLASNPPTTVDAMRSSRGLEGRIPRGQAATELLEAVARGLRLDSSAVRQPPRDELERHIRPAATLVSAWVGQLARDLRIDVPLVATRADLHALLQSDRGRLTEGWRADLVGEPIRRLVSGEAALSFDGRGHLVLEERSGRVVEVHAPLPPVDWVPAPEDDPSGADSGGPDAPGAAAG